MTDKKPESAAELENLMGDLIGDLLTAVVAATTEEKPKPEAPKIQSAPAMSRGRSRR